MSDLHALLDRLEGLIKADPALAGIAAHRLSPYFTSASVVLNGFPEHPGTVEASIWDNAPFGKQPKADGDKGRERPARYAVSIVACAAGHKTPLSTKQPDFSANVGDLFTPDQIRHRIKAIWKGIDPDEATFITDKVLKLAEDNGLLVARLCVKRSARAGGGTHWHPYHVALVSEAELTNRQVSGIYLYAGAPDRFIVLPPCAATSAKGEAFALVSKTTKSGAVRQSQVIGQSRATDLTSDKMQSWKTGDLS